MHEKINKIIFIVLGVLILLTLVNVFNGKLSEKNELKAYDKKVYYFDDYIYLKVYSNDSSKANATLEEINKIYKKYHELTDRYYGYPACNNIYYIYNNNEDVEWLELDSRLYDLLEVALSWSDLTHGYFDIRIGGLVDLWNKHKENGTLPTEEEINNVKVTDVILEDGKIKNNHPNIDLSGIARGYATKKVEEYLASVGMENYIINAGGNVLVGKHYEDDNYKVGLENPTNNNSEIFMTLKAENTSIVTNGRYKNTFEMDGTRYNNIISPITKKATNEFFSVTVISWHPALGDIVSTALHSMSLEDGMAFIDSFAGNEVSAIWYVSEDEQVLSKNANKYIYTK